MANVEINDLTSKPILDLDDEFELQETAGGLSKKTTLESIRGNWFLSSYADLSAIGSPQDGDRARIVAEFIGGEFIYRSAKSGDNDGGIWIDGWCRDSCTDSSGDLRPADIWADWYIAPGTNRKLTDTSAAWSKVWDVVKNAPNQQPALDELPPYILRGSPGQYLISTTVNWTRPTSDASFLVPVINIPGVQFRGYTTGKPVIDMTGAIDINFPSGICVFGTGGAGKPSQAIILLRNADGGSAGRHDFGTPRITGDYTDAAVVNYGSESNVWRGGVIRNDSGYSAYRYTSTNSYRPISSDYTTIPSGYVSGNGDTFYGTEFVYGNSGTVEDDACVILLQAPRSWYANKGIITFISGLDTAKTHPHVRIINSDVTALDQATSTDTQRSRNIVFDEVFFHSGALCAIWFGPDIQLWRFKLNPHINQTLCSGSWLLFSANQNVARSYFADAEIECQSLTIPAEVTLYRGKVFAKGNVLAINSTNVRGTVITYDSESHSFDESKPGGGSWTVNTTNMDGKIVQTRPYREFVYAGGVLTDTLGD